MISSESNKLQFEFTPGERDKALGRGSLRAFIGKRSIWSDEEQRRGVSWTWIDLLEHLASSWPFLKYEESTPLGVHDWMALLREGHITGTDYDFEPIALECARDSYIFVRRHNLATGIEGLYLPSLSLLREGRKIWVVSSTVVKLLDFAETLSTLSELGDKIADLIRAAEPQERSRLAVQAWETREPSIEAVLRIKLGPNKYVEQLIPPDQTLASYFEAENDADAESTILVAARMSEAVPADSQRKILDALRRIPQAAVSGLLERVSAEAQTIVPNYAHRAYEQGSRLAQWARKKFGFAPDVRADAQEVLKKLGVEITIAAFGTEVVDAVGCWGHKHGPAVLVNKEGKHAQSPAGRRTTLAHELAHVLFDRSGSLPAAEVLGGNGPRHPEQRANAFAAEFLLPKQIAVERIRSATDQASVIRALRDHFDVSQEVAAWQILNSSVRNELDSEAEELVNGWAKRGLWFDK